MPRRALPLVLILATQALAQPDRETILVDGFEEEDLAWTFVGGQEFPGAEGRLERDGSVAHSGSASLHLAADFSGGGAYVGLWGDLPDTGGRWLTGLRAWVRSTNVSSIGIRLADDTDQCHQAKAIPIEPDGEWHELVLSLEGLIGQESWGGANDRRWHGPPKALGINVGIDGLVEGSTGELWIDDIEMIVTSEPPGQVGVRPALLSQDRCPPGGGTYVTYRWDAEPLQRDFDVFVHIIGPDGATAFQADHRPPVSTAVWFGPIEYERALVVPTDAPEGEYRIVLGLFSHAGRERNWDRQKLRPAEGVSILPDGTSYEVARFVVDARAPLPPLGEPTLDLAGFQLTFSEEFDGPLDVSAWGPGTRWIAHTPYGGDFGEARFADPQPDYPFTIEDGVLRIEATRDEHGWRSGLLCSVDPQGRGFSQQYGYFEACARFPKGKGTWPAFWLLGVAQLVDRSRDQIEIDVVEQYGEHPNALHATIHQWFADGRHAAEGRTFIVAGMAEDFHRYGALVTESTTTFYFDGVELWVAPTPEEAKVPLYLLINLALGGGWPIDETPDPSIMLVDYVRVYALPDR